MGLLDWIVKGGSSEEDKKKRAAQEAQRLRDAALEGRGPNHLRVDRDGNIVEEDDDFIDLNKEDLSDDWDTPTLIGVTDHRTLEQRSKEDDPDMTDKEHDVRRIKSEELLKEIEEDQTPPPDVFEVADKSVDKNEDKKSESDASFSKGTYDSSLLKDIGLVDDLVEIGDDDLEPLAQDKDDDAVTKPKRIPRIDPAIEVDEGDDLVSLGLKDLEPIDADGRESGRADNRETENRESAQENAQSKNPLNRFRGRAAEFLNSWTKRTAEASETGSAPAAEGSLDDGGAPGATSDSAGEGPSRAARLSAAAGAATGAARDILNRTGEAVDSKASWLRGGWIERMFRADSADMNENLDSRLSSKGSFSKTAAKVAITYVARRAGVKIASDLLVGGLRNYYTISERRELEEALKEAIYKPLDNVVVERDADGRPIGSRIENPGEAIATARQEELGRRLTAVQSKIENSLHLKNSQKRELLAKLTSIQMGHTERERAAYNEQIDAMVRDIRIYTDARGEQMEKMNEVLYKTLSDAKTEMFNTGMALMGGDLLALPFQGMSEAAHALAPMRAMGFMGIRVMEALEVQYAQARHKGSQKPYLDAIKGAMSEKWNTIANVSYKKPLNQVTVGDVAKAASTFGSVLYPLALGAEFLAANGLNVDHDQVRVDEHIDADVPPEPRGESVVGTTDGVSTEPAAQGGGMGDVRVAEAQTEAAGAAQKAVEDAVSGESKALTSAADGAAAAERAAEGAPQIARSSIELGLTRRGDGLSQALARQIEKMPAEQFRIIADKYGYEGNQDSEDYEKFVARYTRDLIRSQGLLGRGLNESAIGEVATAGVVDESNPFGMRIEFAHKDGTPLSDEERARYLTGAAQRVVRATRAVSLNRDVVNTVVETGADTSRASKDAADLLRGSVFKIGEMAVKQEGNKWMMGDKPIDAGAFSGPGRELFDEFVREHDKAQAAIEALRVAEESGDAREVRRALTTLRAIDAATHDGFTIDLPSDVLDQIGAWRSEESADIASDIVEGVEKSSDNVIELTRSTGAKVEMDFQEDGSMTEASLREFKVLGKDLTEAKKIASLELGGALTPSEIKRYYTLRQLSNAISGTQAWGDSSPELKDRLKWVQAEMQKMQRAHPLKEGS